MAIKTIRNNMKEKPKMEVCPGTEKGKRYRLGDARGIRRELASVYAQHRSLEIDDSHAKTATYILRTMLESVRLDEVEVRISQLEAGAVK